MRDTAVALSFNNVIDAFHRLGPENIQIKFFIDERKTNNGIRLTEELRKLSDVAHPDNLPHETEARWRLVETAWGLGVNPSLIEYAKEGVLRLNHPHRDLVRSIGVYLASPPTPWSRPGALF